MPQSNTEEIKSKLDIVDVIREYIELKSAGTNLKARCPFHNEKTPSFMVSQSRQMYHCFGCGEHGDIFSFIMKMEGIEFPEALRILAKKAGVTITYDDPRVHSERTKLLDILRFSSRVFQEHLRRLPESHPVKQYCAERKLSDDLIDTFQIGFAPDSWDALIISLNKKNVRMADAQTAGLVVRRDDGSGFYDRFRARLMFPICDVHGNIVGFGGRVIPNFDARCGGKEAAKYINTPQSPVYNKSQILYGLHIAKNSIRTEKKAVVVEGYMDCIAAHGAGTENVVASSGTAFTLEQSKLLKRFTDTVIVAFDMDVAGIAAASRGVEVLLAEQLTVRVATLAHGKDPDELIKKDPAAWKQALEKPSLFLDFVFEQVIKGKNLQSVEDKKATAKELLPIISRVANPIEQTHYLQRLSLLINVEEPVLRQSLQQLKVATHFAKAKTSAATAGVHDPKAQACQELLSVILKKPAAYPALVKNLLLDAVPEGIWRELYKTLQSQYTSEGVVDGEHLRTLVSALPGTISKEILERLDIAELGASRLPDDPEEAGRRIVSLLMQEYLKKELSLLSTEISKAEKLNDKEKIANLISIFEQLTKELKRFSSIR